MEGTTNQSARSPGAAPRVTLEGCQQQMFERMVRWLLALTALVVASRELQGQQDRTTLVVEGLCIAGLALVTFATALPWRLRCWGFALLLVSGATTLLYLGSFQGPNALVVVTVATVMLTSCMGVPVAAVTLALYAGGFAFVADAFVNRGHTVDMTRYDQAVAGNWVRAGITFVLLSAAGIAFVGVMLRRLSDALHRSHELLDEAERQAREQVLAAEQRARLESELQQAQKFEALGRLAGGVAHDLNNLLVVILNNAAWIAQIGDDEAKEAAREIEQAGDRAAKLARNLLQFGSEQANPLEPLDFDAAISAAVDLVRTMLPSGIRLEFEPGGAGTVRSCATDLDQLLMNLCLNARDAMPAGGTITVTTDRCEGNAAAAAGPTPAVVLRVTDQGHGIAEAVRPHIFEPFFTTKERRKGTGLGLAVVRGIVKQHQGTVSLRSAVGKGTTFEIRLPASSASPTGQAPPASPPAPTARQRAATILVLEDDDQVRRITTNALRQAGHEVHDFAAGRDLLAWCRQDRARADLLVTDVNLDEHSGLEIYRHARLLFPDLSCLVCSGTFANPVDPEFFREPNHDRLDKPFRDTDLVASVERLLESRHPGR